jgi:hypothetical protein
VSTPARAENALFALQGASQGGLPSGPGPLRSGLPPAGERLGAARASPMSLAAVPRRHGGGARCPCLQVGGLVDVSGADRRARGLRGELYAGVGVALNCCARAYVLALLAIPDLMA